MIRTNSFSRAAIFFAVVCLAPFLFHFMRGLSPFWGDLTYLQHPWRVFDSQKLMTGRLPLWNPYLYFGMPQMAAMQDGLFYPASILFDLFRFPNGLFFFHVFHYWLACFLCYLWIRSLGFSHASGLSAGLIWGLSGIALSREPFLNHLSSLSMFPALFLFLDIPLLFALTLSLLFFGGYPPFLAGALFSTVLIIWTTRSEEKKSFLLFLRGSVLSLGFSAALFFPARELFQHSVRALGISTSEAFQFHLTMSDLPQWISPVFGGIKNFNPAVHWWTCLYLGFSGFFLLILGLTQTSLKKRFFLLLWILTILILSLAGSNIFSSYLWLHIPGLKFVRYPGNISYLLLPPAALAVAFGVKTLAQKLRIGSWLPAVLLSAELLFYAWNAFPLISSSFFAFKGPLTEFLQNNLGNNRYLLSPLALEKSSGQGFWDWKSRLYGLTNSPFQLSAAGNFGQPLVPKNNYALMNFLYGTQGLKNVSQIMPWADIQYLLAPSKIFLSQGLKYQRPLIWEMYETVSEKNLSRAYFLSPKEGQNFPLGLTAPRTDIALNPLKIQKTQGVEGYHIFGNGRSGWVFISEPKYPGWKIELQADGQTKTVQSLPALKAFQKVQVPKGWSALFLIYHSTTVYAGLLITIFSFLFLFFYAVSKMGQLSHENSSH